MENIFEVFGVYLEVLAGNASWWEIVLIYYFTASMGWFVSRTLFRVLMITRMREKEVDLFGSAIQGLFWPALVWVWLRESIYAINFYQKFDFWPGEYGDRLREANEKLVQSRLRELAVALHSLYESEQEARTVIYRINPSVVPRATILARQMDLAEIRKKINMAKPRFYKTRDAAKHCIYYVEDQYENYLK